MKYSTFTSVIVAAFMLSGSGLAEPSKPIFAGSPEHTATLTKLRALIDKHLVGVGDDKSLSGKPRLLKDHPLPVISPAP